MHTLLSDKEGKKKNSSALTKELMAVQKMQLLIVVDM
jgi:hypothetical protein